MNDVGTAAMTTVQVDLSMDSNGTLTDENSNVVEEISETIPSSAGAGSTLIVSIRADGGTPVIEQAAAAPTQGSRFDVSGSWRYDRDDASITLMFPDVPGQVVWTFSGAGAPAVVLKITIKRLTVN